MLVDLAGPDGRALRSGSGSKLNYEEARGAQSRADFVHKVRVALKELRETHFWLRLVQRAELVAQPDLVTPLVNEADELIAILTASANTASRG